ncbi:TPA: restriction endonuclease subunit S [Streptococcus suis]|nr:restriction endonuclease subunit S [Streptococcus suis]NQM02710.1 restriction endonuclease subunit S [Streptococcus suis]HEM4136772.1 restriction endonuclease subunit S [Streptococcus suis]
MTRMKDSGNPWVREIPSDWFEKKLRYLVKLRGEKSVTTDYKKYVGLENIMSQTGQYVQTGIEVDLTENLTFEVGDILFGKLRPYLRKYWRAEFSGTASSEFVIIKGSSLNLNFLFWAIQSDSFINDVDSSTYGSKMPRASWEYMKNIKLPFPESIEEQTQIADFLDKKVAQLDKVKSLLEEQIKTLEDYRKSLIYETVTKGLDKTVPLKDSGVDWIGQIPEGWGITKIKFTTQLNGRIGWQGLTSAEYKEEGPYLITGTDFLDGKINFETAVHIDEKRWFEAKQIQVENGDLLITKDGTVGKVAIIEGLNERASLNSGVLRIQTTENISRRFLFYVLKSDVFWLWFNYTNSGASTILHLYQNVFDEFSFTLPNVSEQNQIIDFLDKKTEQINQMIAIKKEQIENINKQRQTLIYDVVTGKRRV